MTPEIHDHYNRLLAAATWIGVAVATAGGTDELRRFIDVARPHANGTLDAILPHFMSIRDMRSSQENLTRAIKTSEYLLALAELLAVEPESEAA